MLATATTARAQDAPDGLAQGATCLADAAKTLSPKDAAKYCLKLRKIEADELKHQADANRPRGCNILFGGCASQPVFMNGGYYIWSGQRWVVYNRPAGHNVVYGTSGPTARRK